MSPSVRFYMAWLGYRIEVDRVKTLISAKDKDTLGLLRRARSGMGRSLDSDSALEGGVESGTGDRTRRMEVDCS